MKVNMGLQTASMGPELEIDELSADALQEELSEETGIDAISETATSDDAHLDEEDRKGVARLVEFIKQEQHRKSLSKIDGKNKRRQQAIMKYQETAFGKVEGDYKGKQFKKAA